ncbi:class I adenylate-forming enzyme family protein [Micromonospora sp. CPCC 205546]|uniref:class I adenylate-forming enzyme family protein n=1 Tax=Micromonospora sp. CPCC 205546 TaxID=3122397 RepID=UPI002FEFEB3A
MDAPTEADRAHTYLGTPRSSLLTPHPTVLAAFLHQVTVRPDAPYITFLAGPEPVTLSYRDVDRESRRMARWLAGAGVTRGTQVCFSPSNDLTSVVTLYALLRSGCPTLLTNPGDPESRVRQQAALLDVDVFLRGPRTVHGIGVDVPDPASLPATLPEGPGDAELDPHAAAFFFGTSGSTAASKIVTQSHYNGVVNAYALIRHHGLTPDDRLLGCLPVHHVNGLHFTVFGVAVAGAHVVLDAEFDPFRYPGLLQTYRPRIASIVPSIVEVLAQTWRLAEPPAGLDYVVTAAAPLTASAARTFVERTGVRVLQGYGLTETTNFSTTVPPDVDDETYRRFLLDCEIPSVGTPLFGNEVRILRENGSFAGPGEVGEICMRGHNVMTEYAANPEATAEAFAGGWFHSQDMGFETHDAAGRPYVTITGRVKNIAKVRGEAVSLDEMDRVLRAMAPVRDAACVSVPDRYLGEKIIAAVVWAPGVGAQEVDLRAALREHFAESLLPAQVVHLDAIPRTPTGKVLRPQLREILPTLG